MCKKYLLSLLVLFAVNLYAQQRHVALKWEDKNYQTEENKAGLLPVFQPENFQYIYDEQIIEYADIFPDSQFADENSVQITNVRYETIDINKYKNINPNNISASLNIKVKSASGRGDIKTSVRFSPIIKQGNGYQKVVSLDFTYSYKRSLGVNSLATSSLNQTQSVLAQGDWFKFKINETGIYRLDKSFLTSLGIPENTDPRTIKIYGHGGQMMPLGNADNHHFDLPEIAIRSFGEEDGVMNDGDYFLFYGVGNKGWSEQNGSHLNLYSTETYYYITYGGNAGKRMQALTEPSAAATVTYTTFDERAFHEQDLTNVAKLSRRWVGEYFAGSGSQNFILNTQQADTSEPATLTAKVVASAAVETSFRFSLNGSQIGNQTIGPKSTNYSARETTFTEQININGAETSVSLQYQNGGVPTSVGYLDYIAIDYKKKLQGYGKQFGFSVKDASSQIGVAQYQLSNAQDINEVWDVTDIYNPQYLTNNQSNFSFKSALGEVKKFHTLSSGDVYQPVILPNSRVANQNLKGTIFNDGDVDYLIITHQNLLNEANRLAQFHKNNNNLNVKVVPVHLIYEEFSSGKQDIVAIRNFIRYVYQNASNPANRLRFVNLFGDASYDYLDRVENNTNIVPVFHAVQNTNANVFNYNDWSCFMTDDFYALMDDEEGYITGQNYSGIDIAVGRIPVSNTVDASAVVNKIIQYHSVENTGRWKNQYIALADDVDSTSDISLQESLEVMASDLEQAQPYINFNKIYTDSYQQQVASGGPRYPQAKKDFLDAFDAGALMVNYLGHGNELGLAGERLLEPSDIGKMNNQNKYPLFAILTCEFTRFDNPENVSGGELLLLKRNAGVMGLLATTRKIGISNANTFTIQLSKYLFNIGGISSNDITIGEALRQTKNSFSQNEKSIVFFLGDPAVKLAIPKPKVELTHINETPIQDFDGSLRALDKIKLSGEVTNESNQLISNFNGDLAIQIFDKEIDRQTLGNDNVYRSGELYVMDFKTLGETVFRGNATVNNGKFEVEFVVPKDIKTNIGNGKASFYAVNQSQHLDDYTGYNKDIQIGGINENAAEDNKSPEVTLYMNDENFVSGGITNESPLFIAYMEDENGINTAGGIGHDLVAILDGDENNPIVLNDYYETEPNNFRKGFIKYPFSDLENGLHTLTFKVWDVYNNPASAEIQFLVAKEEGVSLKNVLNYPNPFVDYTEFWFEHNRPTELLMVQVQIFTVTGKIVKTINQTVVSDGNLSREITWDGRDDFGDKIGKGVYIYRLMVKSTLTGHQTEKLEKLVIL